MLNERAAGASKILKSFCEAGREDVFIAANTEKMSEWIQVKSDKKKKSPVDRIEEARAGSATGGGLATERAVFWGETTKKAAAKLEAYDREQGRHGDAIVSDTKLPIPKTTGIPNAEAIGAAFTCERFGKDENLLKKRLRLNLPFSEVDAVVRQIVNMLDNDFRKATDCKWHAFVLALLTVSCFTNSVLQVEAGQRLALS